MEGISYEHLHREHMEWLSKINFWREEIRALKAVCTKMCINKKVPARIYHAEIFNQLNHHARLLNNMESQIRSHENFMKEMLLSNGIDDHNEGMGDHDHNRNHINTLGKSIKKLKQRIYKEAANNSANNVQDSSDSSPSSPKF